MSRFYGSMMGHGSKINTKIGQRHIEAHIRTWDHGIHVAYQVLDNGKISCTISTTGGSNQPTKQKLIKQFVIDDPGNIRPGFDFVGNARGNVVAE